MLDFLVFVTYIMDVKQVTYTEAKIEAVNVCENIFFDTRYNSNEKLVAICEESVWKNSFPNVYNK